MLRPPIFRFSQKIEISKGTNIILAIVLANLSIWLGLFISQGLAFQSIVVDFSVSFFIGFGLVVCRYILISSRKPFQVFLTTLYSLLLLELIFITSFLALYILGNPASYNQYIQTISLTLIIYALFLLYSAESLELKTELLSSTYVKVTERSKYVLVFNRKITVKQPDGIFKLSISKMSYKLLAGKYPVFLSLEQVITQSISSQFNLYLAVDIKENTGVQYYPGYKKKQPLQLILLAAPKGELIGFLKRLSEIAAVQIVI